MNEIISIVIPPAVGGVPGVFNLQAKFKVLSCVQTNGAFVARSSSGTNYNISQAGQGFGTPQGTEYGSVVFFNAGVTQVTAQIFIGYEMLPQTYISNQLTAVATISSAPVASGQFNKIVVAPGNPVAMGAGVFFTAKIIAQKTVAPVLKGGTANAGNVYIGAGAGAGNQPLALAPGDEVEIGAAGISPRNFSDWYVDADNAGDGIVVIYS